MLKVAVVQCPSMPAAMPPIEPAQLAGCVSYCSHEPRVFDFNQRSKREGLRPDSWAEEILAWTPDVVVFSVSPGTEDASVHLASRIKSMDRPSRVLLSGPYFSAFEKAEALAGHGFGAVIAGPIEDLIPKLLGLYSASNAWVPLPGVITAGASGGRPVPYTFDLDLAPFMDFSGFRAADYERPTRMPMLASRGCPWRCDFCAARERWPKHSFKSGDRLFTEAAYIRRQQPGWTHIELCDIMANGNVDSLVRFGELALENGWPARGVTWSMQAAARPEMTPQALDAFARAGCVEIVYGIETGSQVLLEAMGKPIQVPDIERVLRDTRSVGIRACGTLLVGHPRETEEDFERTLGLLRRTRRSLARLDVRAFALEEPSALWRGGARLGPSPDDVRRRMFALAEVAAASGLECELIGGPGEQAPREMASL